MQISYLTAWMYSEQISLQLESDLMYTNVSVYSHLVGSLSFSIYVR